MPVRYTATEMMVPPEFFGDVLVPQAHSSTSWKRRSSISRGMSSLLRHRSVQTRFVNVLQRPRLPPRPLPQPMPRAVDGKVPEPPVSEVRQVR